MIKQWIKTIKDLHADAWRPALQDTKERFLDNLTCAIFGHPEFDGDEDEYYCRRCFIAFKYPENVVTKADYETFIVEVCTSHKRRYSNG